VAKRIGELLVEQGHIQTEELDKALQMQSAVGGRLGSLLVRTGAVSEEVLTECLSEQLGFPLCGRDLETPDPAHVFTSLRSCGLDVNWCVDNDVIVWSGNGGDFHYAARDILSPFILDCLRHVIALDRLKPCLFLTSHFESLLDYLRREQNAETLFAEGSDSKALRELAEEAPVVELVNSIFSKAVAQGASDIHIEPNEDRFQVRYRIDGVLHFYLEQPSDRFAAVSSRIKLISGIDIAERRLPQDGRITSRFNGREMDVRVSTLPGVHGESIVMRLLPKDREDLSLERLGMEPDHLQLMGDLMHESNGLVLVTGPTGSGKSTTLYASLHETNDGTRKVVTVEDPVEYQLPGITQVQAHADIGYTFERALRAFLRQDPDVIMVGEIRDSETAEIAIQSALTGHLVLSTLHTNDALSAFTRLIDMGVEPFLVAAPVKAVQAQRLIRKVCSTCSAPVKVPESIAHEFASLKVGFQPSWVKADGCSACGSTGYKGRMGIYEIIPMSSELHDLVVGNAPVAQMRQLSKEQGHRTLYQDGLIKAARGLTTLEEVMRVSNDTEG